jgi:hypothetical protein
VHWLEGMQAGPRGVEPLGSARVSEQQGARVDVDVAEPTQEVCVYARVCVCSQR